MDFLDLKLSIFETLGKKVTCLTVGIYCNTKTKLRSDGEGRVDPWVNTERLRSARGGHPEAPGERGESGAQNGDQRGRGMKNMYSRSRTTIFGRFTLNKVLLSSIPLC